MSEFDNGTLTPAIRVLTRLARILDHTETGLSLPQYRILGMVDRGDRRASRLAESLAVKKSTVTVVVDGLVSAGFLSRDADDADRRVVTLRLTGAGRQALARADDALGESLAPLLSAVSEPQKLLDLCVELGAQLDAGINGTPDLRSHSAVTAR